MRSNTSRKGDEQEDEKEGQSENHTEKPGGPRRNCKIAAKVRTGRGG